MSCSGVDDCGLKDVPIFACCTSNSRTRPTHGPLTLAYCATDSQNSITEITVAVSRYGTSTLSYSGLDCFAPSGDGQRLDRKPRAAGPDTYQYGAWRGCGNDFENSAVRLRAVYNPAMRQSHYVPARRTSFSYLCKLYRGFAETDTFLRVLADGGRATAGWKLVHFSQALFHLARRCGAFCFTMSSNRVGCRRIVRSKFMKLGAKRSEPGDFSGVISIDKPDFASRA